MGEYIIGSDGELYHHGIKGMKWGVRRYQNPDGSLTAAGQKRLEDYKTRERAEAVKRGAIYEKKYSSLKEETERNYEKS